MKLPQMAARGRCPVNGYLKFFRRSDAKRFGRRMKLETGKPFTVFQCDYCAQFHARKRTAAGAAHDTNVTEDARC